MTRDDLLFCAFFFGSLGLWGWLAVKGCHAVERRAQRRELDRIRRAGL